MERHGGVDRQNDCATGAFGLVEDAAGGAGQVLLDQRLADVEALSVQEGVGHGAADHQALDLGDQVFQEVKLGRNLGAADDGDHRPLWFSERLVERFELGLHGSPRIGRELPAEPFG